MATKTNPAKVGLFVVCSVLAGIVCLFWAGVSLANRPRVPRVTFFDESVQGLDVGAPVKMRGVTIGQVKDVTIAPDQRLVKVTAEVFVDLWVRLGLGTEAELRTSTKSLPPDLRTQLATTGITGEKFLLVDFFANPGPVPELTFVPPYNYIPSTPSTLKSLEDGVNALVDQLPRTLDRVDRLAGLVEEKVAAFDAAEFVSRTNLVLDDARGFFSSVDGALAGVDLGRIDADLKELLSGLSRTVARAEALLEDLDAPDGSFQRVLLDFRALAARAEGLIAKVDEELAGTSDSFEGVAREAALLSGDARLTLARLREALGSVQALAALLEREPGALLRGHPTEFAPPGGR